MTQQTIDVGAVANDGTGESLRNAFNAVNNNFANVWTAGPVDSQVVISNNVVSTNVNNLDLILAGNGIGNIAIQSTLVPAIDSVYGLGTANLRFDTIHSQYFYGNGAFLTGVSGNSGSTTTFSANVPAAPNIGDIWIQSTTGVQYIYFNDNTSSQWAEMEASLNISSGTGGTGNVDLTAVGSDIIPNYNNSYNLGNSTNQWKDLWVSNATIFMNSVPLTSDGANLKYNGNTVLTTSSSLTYSNLSVTGSVVTNALYTDNYYYANGAPFPQGSNSLPGTTISLKDNAISTTITNQNLILSGNGIGNIQVNSSVMPVTDNIYDVGSPTYRFNTVYSDYVVGNSATFTSNVSATGNIFGSYIFGNGYFLTGVGNGGSGNVNLTYVQSNILPAANAYNIGNASNQWQNLWVNDTITLSSIPLTMVGNTLRVNGNSVVVNNGSLTLSALSVTGNTVTDALYTDNYYYANGAPFPQGSNSLPGTTVSIKDNVITTTTLNQNLVLGGNGVGNIQVNSSITPGITGVYEIGSPTAKCDSVYSSYVYGNVVATNVTVNSGGFMKLPVYTAANLRTYAGQAGWIATVSNSSSPAGKMAFWDTTNNRWSYVCDNTAV
jgi:hypothetical protein